MELLHCCGEWGGGGGWWWVRVGDRHVSVRLVKFIIEGRCLAEGKGRTDYSENRTRQTNEEIRRRKVQRNIAISFISCLGFACVTETLCVLPHRNHDACFVPTVVKFHVLFKYTQTNIFTRFTFFEPRIVIFIIRSNKMHTFYINVLI